MILTIIAIVIVIGIWLAWITPFTRHRALPGRTYYVRNVAHTLPDFHCNKRPFLLKKRVLDQMATLFETVTRLFDEHHIGYVINAGTLLGAVRHQGFIPWDDDIDLMIPISEQDKLIGLIDVFKHHGLKLTPARGGYKIGFKNWLTAYPYIDLVIAKERSGSLRPCLPQDPNGFYTYEVAIPYPNEHYIMSHSFPAETCQFEGFSVRCPKNLSQQVSQQYGENALTTVKLDNKGQFPWVINHYFDNVLYHLGLIQG